jgi:hypothetical protein
MTPLTTTTCHISYYFTTTGHRSIMRTNIPETYILTEVFFMNEYTVKEVATLIGKHEETIKCWIRSGKLPNSFRNSDKEGWIIPESELLNLNNGIQVIKV